LFGSQVKQNAAHAQFRLVCTGAQIFDGLVADAARRQIDDPQQTDLIGRVLHSTQVGDHILDFLAPVKALSSYQPVRQTALEERLFQKPGLGVGAVHDGDIAALGFFAFQ